jgi:hypothetical protein
MFKPNGLLWTPVIEIDYYPDPARWLGFSPAAHQARAPLP